MRQFLTNASYYQKICFQWCCYSRENHSIFLIKKTHIIGRSFNGNGQSQIYIFLPEKLLVTIYLIFPQKLFSMQVILSAIRCPTIPWRELTEVSVINESVEQNFERNLIFGNFWSFRVSRNFSAIHM